MGRLWFSKDKLGRVVAYATRQYEHMIMELSHCSDNERYGSLLSAVELWSAEARTARAQLIQVLETIEAIIRYAALRKRDPSMPLISKRATGDAGH